MIATASARFCCMTCGDDAVVTVFVPEVGTLNHALPSCCSKPMRLVMAPLGIASDGMRLTARAVAPPAGFWPDGGAR